MAISSTIRHGVAYGETDPNTPRRSLLVRAARWAISRLGDGLYAAPKWCSLKKMPSKARASARVQRSMYQRKWSLTACGSDRDCSSTGWWKNSNNHDLITLPPRDGG